MCQAAPTHSKSRSKELKITASWYGQSPASFITQGSVSILQIEMAFSLLCGTKYPITAGLSGSETSWQLGIKVPVPHGSNSVKARLMQTWTQNILQRCQKFLRAIYLWNNVFEKEKKIIFTCSHAKYEVLCCLLEAGRVILRRCTFPGLLGHSWVVKHSLCLC